MAVNFEDSFNDKQRQKVIDDSMHELEFSSLLGIISKYCYSELGKDIIAQLRPNSDIEKTTFDLNLIQDFQNLLNSGEEIPFHGLYDTNKSVNKSKIQGAILGTEELLNIKDNIKTFRVVKNYFRVNESNNTNNSNILELLKEVFDNRILEKHIEDAIDDNGNIKDNATKELSRIRSEIRAKSGSLRNRIQKILKKTIEDDIVNEDFYTIYPEK
jgi:DNA mismatch repair protein MutS2